MDELTGAFPARAKHPGEQEIRLWCDETRPHLYRYIYRRVQNREEAEDLTQETYVHALRNLPEQAEELPSQAYLQVVALNLIRDRWRRLQTHGTEVPWDDKLADEDRLEKAIDASLLRQMMEQLPADYRLVLQLRIVEGRTRKETARRMGRGEDSVRGLQYRAVRALRRLMADYLEEVER